MEVGEESFGDKDGGGVGSPLVMRMKVVRIPLVMKMGVSGESVCQEDGSGVGWVVRS